MTRISLNGLALFSFIIVASSVAVLLLAFQPVVSQLGTSVPTLTIFNRLNNTLGNQLHPNDFKMVVVNLNFTKQPNRITETFTFINGSDKGTKLTLNPGTFMIRDNTIDSKPLVLPFNKTFTGDCKPNRSGTGIVIGSGSVKIGEDLKCVITRSLPK